MSSAKLSKEPRPAASEAGLPTTGWLGLIALVGLAGLIVRVVDLPDVPPGLHFDQAANGLLGLEILSGRARLVFFSSYAGREALFMYLIAALCGVLGPGVWALRLAGALSGAATIVAVAFLGSALYGRRIGVLAGAFLAGLYWHLHVSRLAERTILVPLLDTLTLLALWEAFRRRSPALAAIGGGLAGLQLYTYPSSRFFLLALVAIGLVELVWRRGRGGPHPRPLSNAVGEGGETVPGDGRLPSPLSWRGAGGEALAGVALLAAILVATPLAVHFAHHPEDFLSRAGQVAVWDVPGGRAAELAALATSTGRTLAMFAIRGDSDWKYNLANRPVFDPISAALFLTGLGAALWRRGRADRVITIWWLSMLLPGFLSVDAPQFMRTLGAAPASVLFAARGLDAAVNRLRRSSQGKSRRVASGAIPRTGVTRRAPFMDSGSRIPDSSARLMAPLLLAWPVVAGALAVYQYFAVWAPSPAAYLALEGDVADAARIVRARAPGYAATYVASRYGPNPTVAFLAADQLARLHWFDGRVALPLPPPDGGPTLYVLPRSAIDPYWLERLPAADRVATVAAPDGAPAVESFVLRPGELAPASRLDAPISFGGVARLIGADLSRVGQAGAPMNPSFFWQIDRPPPADVKFFVHLVDATGQTWAQYDEVAYPAADWRPGQVLVVRARLDVPDYLPVGAYRLATGLEQADGSALPAVSANGEASGVSWKSDPIPFARPAHPPALASLALGQPINALFGDSVRLVGATVGQDAARDGDVVPVTLVWQVLRPPGSDLTLTFRLASATGTVLSQIQGSPTNGIWPASDWQAGDVVVDRQRVLIPAGTASGPVSLGVALTDPTGRLLAVSGEPSGLVPIGRVAVTARPRSAVSVAISHPQAATFQAPIDLLGYDVAPTSVRPGQMIDLTLYWRADRPVSQSWTVFTHLLDGDQKIRAQEDGIPDQGRRPTTTWAPGEVIVDRYRLRVDPAAPSGANRLEIGLYDPTTGQRLPLASGDDRVLLNLPVQVLPQAAG